MVAKWKLVLLGTAALGVLLPIGLYLNNNFRLSRLSRSEFEQRLTRAMDLGNDWILGNDMADQATHKRILMELLSNSALLYMLVDCDHISAGQTFAPLTRLFFANSRELSPWHRLVNPALPRVDPDPVAFGKSLDYQRWFLWVLDPNHVTLPAHEKADLDSPDRMKRGRLTHQIFAWNLYRRLYGTTPELDRFIRHLCERAAQEASLDFRVTDQYLQRVAFILHAGHPDLVNPRWVERALEAQQDDGGWTWSWNGWGPRAFEFRLPEQYTSAHPSAQGVWITYLLKYRYPEWIKSNYP